MKLSRETVSTASHTLCLLACVSTQTLINRRHVRTAPKSLHSLPFPPASTASLSLFPQPPPAGHHPQSPTADQTPYPTSRGSYTCPHLTGSLPNLTTLPHGPLQWPPPLRDPSYTPWPPHDADTCTSHAVTRRPFPPNTAAPVSRTLSTLSVILSFLSPKKKPKTLTHFSN